MEHRYPAWQLDQLESEGMAWPPERWEEVGPIRRDGGQPIDTPAVTEAVAAPTQSRWRSARSLGREIIETIILTLVIFFLIRTVVQNFRIEGFSMEPNLHAGQYLIVNKFVYRWLHPPQRGDVIVFEYPRSPDRDFIKRVIGLPGEKVEVRRGKVYINDRPLDEPYLNTLGSYDWGPQVIGPDEYFVLGDNRNNSSDSHSWGTLPKANIIGKAWVSYWPPKYWGLIETPNSFASSN